MRNGSKPHDVERENAEREQAERRRWHARPVHLRWQALALVAAGGTVGTALRELLVLTLPIGGAFPGVIFAINLVGAFLLGALLDLLSRSGPDDGRRRALRLLLGTGVLGGFTTYSALATDTSVLLARDNVNVALLYAGGTLVLGAIASWAGIAGSAAVHRQRRRLLVRRAAPPVTDAAAK